MKVPCGGFNFNDSQFDMNNDVVSLKNGSGGDSRIVDMVLTSDLENERYIADKTWTEVSDAIKAGKLVISLFNQNIGTETSTSLLIFNTYGEFESEGGTMVYYVQSMSTNSIDMMLSAPSKDEYLYSN